MRYAINAARIGALSTQVAQQLDELADDVTAALGSVDDAAEQLSRISGVRAALDAASGERKRTGPGLVSRAGAALAALEQNTLVYAAADQEMANRHALAQADAAHLRAAQLSSSVIRRGFGATPQ